MILGNSQQNLIRMEQEIKVLFSISILFAILIFPYAVGFQELLLSQRTRPNWQILGAVVSKKEVDNGWLTTPRIKVQIFLQTQL